MKGLRSGARAKKIKSSLLFTVTFDSPTRNANNIHFKKRPGAHCNYVTVWFYRVHM